jgi:hypothetical protein
MSTKIELEWFSTDEKQHPDLQDTDRRFPTWCLVDRVNDGLKFLPWDHTHECWNDDQDDDYECGPEGVKGWAILPDKAP